MLAIIIPVIESETKHISDKINQLKKFLEKANLIKYKIYFIIQSNKNFKKLNFDKVEFIETKVFSVSHARNIGLKSICKKIDYLYFLDFDATPSINFLIQSKKNIDNNLSIWSGSIFWSEYSLIIENNFNMNYIKKNIIDLPYHQFLGCFIFKRSLLKKNNIIFNEDLGPGKNTKLKAGEDVLFLAEVFSKNKIKDYFFYNNLKIFHPPRFDMNLKSILYCEGQVYVHKLIIKSKLMSSRLRLASFLYLNLFILNGFKKIIFFEDHSLRLFYLRVLYIFKPMSLLKKKMK